MRRTAGYAALIERLGLKLPTPRHTSSVGPGVRERQETPEGVHEFFPEQFARADDEIEHLVFALKYDGVDLLVLRSIFEAMAPETLTEAIRQSPTSAYLRRLWFFWEWLLEAPLPLADATTGAYVDALDSDEYITRPGARLRRYRVNFNLLSTSRDWCPLVRRTATIKRYEESALNTMAHEVMSSLSPRDLQRAIRYLYTKETRASFEIERETPSDRMERFVEALFSHGSGSGPLWWDKEALVEVAGIIVAERFAPKNFRTKEVRVSEQHILTGRERTHFVGPRFHDLEALMAGFVDAWQSRIISKSYLDPLQALSSLPERRTR